MAGLTLQRAILWSYTRPDVPLFGPFAAQPLANGNVLITDRDNAAVIEVNRAKTIVWSYTQRDDPRLISPNSAERLANGNTLIVDRRADRVFEVTRAKRVVWEYGAHADSLSPGSLVDPYSATRLANGDTLITDNRGGTRVIEVRSTDYDVSAPDLGYTPSSIVWRYGRDDDAGTGDGQLSSPRRASRLDNGNTLIVDAADQEFFGNRVIEVDPSGSVVWRFDGQALSPPVTPSDALRVDDGSTLVVAEEGGGAIYDVDRAGRVRASYSSQALFADGSSAAKLRTLLSTSRGTLVISDQGNQRVFEVGYPEYGTVTSPTLDLGLPGVKKAIGRMEMVVDKPEGTAATIEYSLDGGSWKSPNAGGGLPAGTTAVTVRYRVTLSTTDQGISPVLRELRIAWDLVPPSTTTTSAAPTTTTHRAGATGTRVPTTTPRVTAGSGTGGESPSSAKTAAPAVPPPQETTPPATVASGPDERFASGSVLQPSATLAPSGVEGRPGQEGWGVVLGVLAVPFVAGVVAVGLGGIRSPSRLIPRVTRRNRAPV